MKTITLTIALILSTTVFSQKIESKISLAGTELMKYKKKKATSYILMASGGLLAAMSTTDKTAKPMLYIGGMMGLVGVGINISSLSNIGRASRHLIQYKD